MTPLLRPDIATRCPTSCRLSILRPNCKRLITFKEIEAARERIAGAVFYSPCLPSISLSEITGMQIFCKLDNLQRTGSFKERGARNALDCALWDLEAKRSDKRTWELANIPIADQVETSFTISLDTPARMADAAAAAEIRCRPQASDFRSSAMSRDASNLKVFHLADELIRSVQKLRAAVPEARGLRSEVLATPNLSGIGSLWPAQ